jgi:hypothetical protein
MEYFLKNKNNNNTTTTVTKEKTMKNNMKISLQEK